MILNKAEDKEKVATVESSKVAAESLPVARTRCWKKVLLRLLQKTGGLFICFPWKILLGSC